VGKRGGALANWRPDDLLAEALKAVVKKVNVDPANVDDILGGCVYQIGEQGGTVTRAASLAADFPVEVPAATINRQCGSSLSALNFSSAMIMSGMRDCMIACGIELMSKYPIMADFEGLNKGFPIGPKFFQRFKTATNQGQAAEMIANKWGITAQDMDKFAVKSHQNADKATKAGHFKNEVIPLKTKNKEGQEIEFTVDECIRPDTNLEKLATLKPALATKIITAGRSSPVTDGASAVLLMSEKKMKELKLEPLARVVATDVIGDDPIIMLTGPIQVTHKILKRTGMKISDFDIFEINEAFASVPLAWLIEHKVDPEKLNVNGGALAIGHPVGNSGTRLTTTAIWELKRRKGRYALISLCTGFGMAPVTIIERC
jgi:acetyl-CoA acetyltransferase family protein